MTGYQMQADFDRDSGADEQERERRVTPDPSDADPCKCGHARRSHRKVWSWMSRSSERTGACGKRCGCRDFLPAPKEPAPAESP